MIAIGKYDFIGENGLGQVEISLGGIKKTVTIECDERGRLNLHEPVICRFPTGTHQHTVARPTVFYRAGRIRFELQFVYHLGRSNATPIEWFSKSS